MVAFFLVLICIIAIAVYLYFDSKKQNIEEEVFTTNEEIDDSPLTEQTFKNISLYSDKKQDSRTDAIMHNLNVIKVWIAVIGIYFLLKLIGEIVAILGLISAGYQLNELIQYLFLIQ